MAADSADSRINAAMRELVQRATPPQLVQYDNWGRRVDDLRTSEGWRGLKDVYHREGIVAISYERKYREHSRPYAFAKLFITAADSDVVCCACIWGLYRSTEHRAY